MTTLDGMFSLRSPRDLFAKLEYDHARLIAADPTTVEAQYAAYDFFVCAEHLPDWLVHEWGGTLSTLKAYTEGPLVSHIASGGKHFHVTDLRHTTARNTSTAMAFQAGVFQLSFQGATLVVELEGGGAMSVNELAHRVLAHWRSVV